MSAPAAQPGVVRVMIRLVMERMGPGWWLLTILVLGGTNLLDFLTAARPEARASAAFAVAALLRVVLVFWLGYALIRRLADEAQPFRPGMPLLRFTLFGFGTIALMVVSALTARAVLPPDGPTIAAALLGTVLMALLGMALVRLYGWQAALATGDRSLGARGIWRGLGPHHGRLVLGLLFILPVALAHSLLTFIAVGVGDVPEVLAALAAVDGVVSAVQLVLTAALAVVALRLARAEPLQGARSLA